LAAAISVGSDGPWKLVSRNPAGKSSIGDDEIARDQMKSILDPSFRYTASFNTDLSKTFERVRREHRKDAETEAPVNAGALVGGSPIVRKIATG
jgi:hypothetical protein